MSVKRPQIQGDIENAPPRQKLSFFLGDGFRKAGWISIELSAQSVRNAYLHGRVVLLSW